MVPALKHISPKQEDTRALLSTECRHHGGETKGRKVLIKRDYIAVDYHPDWGEVDLSLPSHVTMDGSVKCIDASVLLSPEEASDVRFGSLVTVTIEIHGGDGE